MEPSITKKELYESAPVTFETLDYEISLGEPSITKELYENAPHDGIDITEPLIARELYENSPFTLEELDDEIAKELYSNFLFSHELLGIKISSSKDHMIPPTADIPNEVDATGKSNADALKIEIKSEMKLPACNLPLKGFKSESVVMDVDLCVLHMLASKEEDLKVNLEEVLSRKGVQSCHGLLNHCTDIIPAGCVSLNRRDLRCWYQADPEPVMEIGFLGPSGSEFVDIDAATILDLWPNGGLTQHLFFLPASGFKHQFPLAYQEANCFMKTFFDDEIALTGPSIAKELDENAQLMHEVRYYPSNTCSPCIECGYGCRSLCPSHASQ